MNLKCVEQYKVAFKDCGWTCHRDILAVARKRNRGVPQTQVNEDLNGQMKNAKRRRLGVQTRRVETLMAIGLESNHTEKRQKYEPIKLQTAVEGGA